MLGVAVVLFSLTSARAGDVESWVGGNVITGLQAVQGPSGAEGTGVGTIVSQAEFDLRLKTGIVFIRLDLDYHLDPWFFGKENPDFSPVPDHYPLPPEMAFVQIGERYHVRMGVTSPNFGMQLWDEKDNYLPTFSNGWALQNGQNLGIEPGIFLDDGATELFLYGGYDMAWLAPGFGGGVSSVHDAWGTWTGVFVLPTYPYFMVHAANEVYPLDWLYLSTEVNAGWADGDVIGGGQIVADILPEASVGFDVRGDLQFVPDTAAAFLEIDVPRFALSGAVRFDFVDWLHVGFEGKESFPTVGDPYFTGTLLVSAQVPGEASDPYVVHDPEE